VSHKTGLLSIVIGNKLVVSRQSAIIWKETKGKGKGSKYEYNCETDEGKKDLNNDGRRVDVDLHVSKVGVCQW